MGIFMEAAQRPCADLARAHANQTIAADLMVAGASHGSRVSTRLWLGWDLDAGSLRLEPFQGSPPAFVFIANGLTDDNYDADQLDGSLILPDRSGAIQQEFSRELLYPLLGVPLSADELTGVMAGCTAFRGSLSGHTLGPDTVRLLFDGDLPAEMVFGRDAGVPAGWTLLGMGRSTPGSTFALACRLWPPRSGRFQGLPNPQSGMERPDHRLIRRQLLVASNRRPVHPSTNSCSSRKRPRPAQGSRNERVLAVADSESLGLHISPSRGAACLCIMCEVQNACGTWRRRRVCRGLFRNRGPALCVPARRRTRRRRRISAGARHIEWPAGMGPRVGGRRSQVSILASGVRGAGGVHPDRGSRAPG